MAEPDPTPNPDAAVPDPGSAPRAFTTSKRDRDGATIDFTLDEINYTAHRPKQSVLVAVSGASGNAFEQLRMIPRFIDACLPPAQRTILANRLRDPDDDLDIDDLVPIFNYLIEEMTGRPTSSQSA